MLLYFYRAVSGHHMPCITEDALVRLRDSFRGSATPLVRVLEIRTANEANIAIQLLQAQKTHTPKSETGLLYDLDCCIDGLVSFKNAALS